MYKRLLDTDIYSEVLKGNNPLVNATASKYLKTINHLTISAISVMEIVRGWRKKRDETRLQRFLKELIGTEILALDSVAGDTAGRIFADLENAGQPIGRMDPMIAAIALQHGLTLVTGNMDHYQRIQTLGYDLKLENWRNNA